jgi:hypothetical protein
MLKASPKNSEKLMRKEIIDRRLAPYRRRLAHCARSKIRRVKATGYLQSLCD